MTRSRPAAAAVALIFLALPSVSAAAETFGSSLSSSADDAIACLHHSGCMLAQTALPGRTVTAPRDGVVVRWRASFLDDVPAQDVRLIVLRRDGGSYDVVGTSAAVTIADGQKSLLAGTALRRVKAGDFLAVMLENGGEIGIATRPTQDAAFALFAPPLAGPFGPRAPDDSGPTDADILLNADVEADADGDGEGDETQDKCPESRSRTDVPCSIDLNVAAPRRPTLRLGSSGVSVRVLWTVTPRLLRYRQPSNATLTIDAPSHAPISRGLGAPCPIVTPQRAVCSVSSAVLLGTSVNLLINVDPRRVPRALVRLGATFTASVSSIDRDANPANNSVTWTSPIYETRCGQLLNGTRDADRITGTAYSDGISGRRGDDTLIGKLGRDCIDGGTGNDRLVANDGMRDTLRCGPGRHDTAIVDRLDRTRGCESVKRKRAHR